jgi:hypothetical protein
LITYLPIVLPQQSVDIPFTATYWGSTNSPSAGGATPGLAMRLKHGGPAPKHPVPKQGEGSGLPEFLEGCIPGTELAQVPAQAKAIADYVNATAEAAGVCQVDQSKVKMKVLVTLMFLHTADAALSVGALGPEGAAQIPEVIATFIGCVVGKAFGIGEGEGEGGNVNGEEQTGPGGGPPETSDMDFNGDVDGCLAPDTLVLMGDGKLKPISKIKANDLVRSGEHSDNLAVVMEVHSLMSTQVCRLTLAGPGAAPHAGLTVTAEHLLWIDGKGWTAAARVRPGDWLFDSHEGRVRVTGNEPLGRSLKVYSMRLAVDNAFYANDVLVHDLCGLAAPLAARKVTDGTPPSGGSTSLAAPVAARKMTEVAR